MLKRIFNGRRRLPGSGTIWRGGVCYCHDQEMVAWPGHYGTMRNEYGHEVVDRDIQLRYDDLEERWVVK